MFEAKLTEGHILKKIVEAIKDLVTDVNIDVSASGKSIKEPIYSYFCFRPLSPSHGHLPRRSGLLEPEHGGFRVIQMRLASGSRYQHQQSLKGHEVG